MSKDITAERIRERRLELGLTQDELAHMVGYSGKSSINKIEKDTRGMSMEKMMEISKALRTSPAYIMGWDDTPFGDDVDRANKVSEIERLFGLLTPEQQQLVTNLIHSLLEARR